MKGHNYGPCRRCGAIHIHPRGALGKHLVMPPFSVEHRRHIAETRKGRHFPELAKAKRGKHYPKLSEAKLGKPVLIPDLRSSAALAYILGVIKGDGYVSQHGNRGRPSPYVGLTVITPAFAVKFAHALEEIGLHPSLYAFRNYYRVWTSSLLFCSWYKMLNLQELEVAVKGFEKDYLCGFYESEGSLESNKRQELCSIRIAVSDLALARLCFRLLRRLGFHPTFVSYHNKLLKKEGKNFHRVGLYRRNEIAAFLKLVSPCIRNGVACADPSY